jgi:hypothetical protein
MRKAFFLLAAAAVVATPASARPPREQSPTPINLFAEIGAGVSDDAAVMAAAAHPLGTLSNPVRVGGPAGERTYLARLRCADGSAPQVGARAAGGVGAFGSVTAAYALDCGIAAPGKIEVVMDMYHDEHAENRAPDGLTIAR